MFIGELKMSKYDMPYLWEDDWNNEEGIDFVTCQICGKQLKRLDGGHIQRVHNISPDEYKRRYPKAKLSCDKYRESIKESVEKLWENGHYDHISPTVKELWDSGRYDDHGKKVAAAHASGVFAHIYTEERNRKISEAQKGVPKSEECKKKIAKAHEAGAYDDAPEKISHTVSKRWAEGKYDHVDWTKVQTRPSTVKKKREASKAAHRRGLYDHIYGDPEIQRKQSEARKQAWERGLYDGVFLSPSGLEIAFAEELDKASIDYEQQYRVGTYLVDFLIEKSLVVEMNGDYWHGSEEAKEYDKQRNDWIRSQGYEVIVFWESEFYNDPEACIEKVKGSLK